MVKVLPNNFTLYESQRILSPTGEPLAVACSNNDLLFIAVEECMIEAYDLGTLEQLAQFRTVSPVAQVAYNVKGDCVVTLERKHTSSRGFVRVYFKWRGLSADKPMRILMASIQRSIPGQNKIAAEIVELPSESSSSVSCLACCEYTGRIAVGMGSLLRVFYLENEREEPRETAGDGTNTPPSPSLPLPPSSSPTPDIEILVDIQTSMTQLEMVSIMGDYIAFISTNEVRVVKLSLFQTGVDPIPDYQPYNEKIKMAAEGAKFDNPGGEIIEDQNFISWSPSAVWEAEKKAKSCSRKPDHVTSHDISSEFHIIDISTTGHVTSSDDLMTSCDSASTQPLIGTLTVKSIAETTSVRLNDRANMEVLGPVEYVWGQPLTISVNQMMPDSVVSSADCRVLTMLYRRFSEKVGSSLTQSFLGLSSNKRASHPVKVQGSGLGVKGGWDGLHTVQLIPTFVEGSGSESPKLVGISCFLANRYHGYLYDVHHQCRLLSSFSFMEQSRLASCDGRLLHALSSESVETYTSRAFQAAIGNLPRGSTVIPSVPEEDNGSVCGGEVEGGGGEEGGEEREKEGSGKCGTRQPDMETWLRQPIPPHKLDLTLVSTSKFIGCCYLATAQNYIIVVTKGEMESQISTGANWLLQSLTSRRAKAEHMWNIYVLRLKSDVSLFQQFMEFSEALKGSSPPMRQHILSEAHVLLRRLILQDGCSSQLLRWLQDNCFQLADSLCHYSRWNGIEVHASHYFIMSGRPIVDVVQHVLSTYTSDHRVAKAVLMSYLNLVLFDHGNAENQMPALLPMANNILELYANHTPSGHMTSHIKCKSGHMTSHVISLLLDSWLSGYSNETALSLLEGQLQSTEAEEKPLSSCIEKMCHAIFCLKAGKESDARQGVSCVPKDSLWQWMNDNLHFVLNTTTLTFTPLGEVVMAVHEKCLLELLVATLKTGKIGFEDLCTLIRGSREDRGTLDRGTLVQEFKLKHFLEIVILDRSKDISMATTTKAVLLLVEVLFARLATSHAPKPPKSTPFTLYGSRHKWLDNVIPFGGDEGVVESAALDRGRGRTPGFLHDLMQLQAVLCSSHMTETVATRVEELLTQSLATSAEEEGEDGLVSCRLSLQMITWPHLGRMKEACHMTLDKCPPVTVDYCQTMFPEDLDLWVWLLEQLLGYTHCDGEPGPLQAVYLTLYKEALSHVLTLTTPQQFLSLLPPSGSVHFFLPFIERSCKLHYSRATSDKLHSSILQQ